MWRGGVGAAYLFPALSSAGASVSNDGVEEDSRSGAARPVLFGDALPKR